MTMRPTHYNTEQELAGARAGHAAAMRKYLEAKAERDRARDFAANLEAHAAKVAARLGEIADDLGRYALGPYEQHLEDLAREVRALATQTPPELEATS